MLKSIDHLLILLLGIEVLTLLLIGLLGRRWGRVGIVFLFVFFTCGVCEARLGLALLVSMRRRWGGGKSRSISVRGIGIK